ncbi:CDP-glycerol glycerophosphotransferase family protein [Populibacterium corticicola]|uniref:CDP-glycerol glycerophosphotransferase family protein n=1 Tax=Populibacterium corticicola TaxID=1812826 RepID=A0ABW5XBM4_9MICO
MGTAKQTSASPTTTGHRALLSIVIPAFNIEEYIGEALSSLQQQSYSSFEAIVVDDGSTDSTRIIAEEFAQKDPRFKIIQTPNLGPGAARNSGIAAASGKYLTFFDGDDLIEPKGYENVIDTLEFTDSDFAVSSYQIFKEGKILPPGRWIRQAHSKNMLRQKLEDYPRILVNAVQWSKVYRKSFWDKAQLRYPEGVLYEDQLPSVLSYIKATSFDILEAPLVRWRRRATGTSIMQQSADPKNLEDRFNAAISVLEELIAHGHTSVAIERAFQYLANSTFTLQYINDGDKRYWEVLVDHLPKIWKMVPLKRLKNELNSRDKVLYHLILTDQYDLALRFFDEDGWDIHDSRPVLIDGQNYVKLPLFDEAPHKVPLWAYIPSPREVRPFVHIEQISLSADNKMELRGTAFFSNIPSNEIYPEVEVLFESQSAVGLTRFPAKQVGSEEATYRSSHRRETYQNTGFHTIIDLIDLSESLNTLANNRGKAFLDFAVRQGDYYAILPSVSATQQSSVSFSRTVEIDGMLFTIRFNSERLTIEPLRPAQVVSSIVVENDSLLLHFAGKMTSREKLYAVLSDDTEREISRALVQTNSHGTPVLAVFPRIDWGALQSNFIQFHVERSGKQFAMFAVQSVLTDQPVVRDLAFYRNAKGHLRAGASSHHRFVTSVTTREACEIVISFSTPLDRTFEIMLEGKTTQIKGVVTADGDASFTLENSPFDGFAPVSFARDAYWLRLKGPDGKNVRPLLHETAQTLIAQPFRLQRSTFDIRYDFGTDEARIRLHSTLGSQRSSAQTQNLRDQYKQSFPKIERRVYLQCMKGDQVSDTQLEMARYFQQNHPEYEVIWGLEDDLWPVPVHQGRVIIDSREYYDVIASAQILCFNHELAPYIENKPGQTIIQTYHGHPFKMMGEPRWEMLNFPKRKRQHGLDWRQTWDILLSPSPDATRMLTEAFPVRAKILEVGHPRNDSLVQHTDAVRTEVRTALGLKDDEYAVLYAPTWRDYSAESPWYSPMTNFVEPNWLASKLGPKVKVLLRGHPSHSRYSDERTRASQVIDVTDYPFVNDLIIASDLGVFDYSSIRFDYSVTKKPMVFFTPDEKEYFAYMPPLVPYNETTPGPVVENKDELVLAIREYINGKSPLTADYLSFIKRFNPMDDGKATHRFVEGILDHVRQRSND